MASRTIYPPLVNSYEPAFVAGSNSSLRVYFSLSSLSNIPAGTNLTVHAQIYRQDGVKVLNTTNDTRYRATGIILNLVPVKSETQNNLYYITINNSDLKSSVTLSGTTFNGWIPGWVYKIQLRLSTVTYNPADEPKQEIWMQKNSDNFSEWSTICYTKAISPMVVQIPIFNYNSEDESQQYDPDTVHVINDMEFFGTIKSQIFEANEDFEYVKLSLYSGDQLLEESGEIYKTEQSNTYFGYDFKQNFQENLEYTIFLDYKTENGYIPKESLEFKFMIEYFATETIDAQLVTVDRDINNILTNLTFLDEEEDEGRIALKIYSMNTNPWSGNICIRRSSQDDNFQIWEDIIIFTVREKDLNTLDLIYDYTIESGKWYKYGIQSIDKRGGRGKLVIMNNPVHRLFNYSYILGQDSKQLKLQFNNTINSFKHQIYDSKTDTLGSKYPFIARNADVNYRTFAINSLISFWMDENNTFLKNGKKDIYNYTGVVDLYDDYVEENSPTRKQYDYTYERDFRKAVLDFLQDGKPKLFKSPTEGNIIVRLMDVSCTPNQTLDRMIYSVTMNANELDDNTMSNYLKYGFYNPGIYSIDFSTKVVKIGQVTGTFTPSDNIFRKIYEKYDSQGKSIGGYKKILEDIQRLRITINGYYYINDNNETEYVSGHQLRVYNNQNELVIGNNILLNYSGGVGDTLITIYDPKGIYEFDSLMKFYYGGSGIGNDSLYLLGDAEGLVTGVDATIDFLYGLSTETYEEHQILERKPVKGIAQFYEEVKPGTSIYKSIYYKHYINSDTIFRYLNNISSIEIEANPHTIFAIKDASDFTEQYHEINDTGILRLYELNDIVDIRYIGKRYLETPYDDNTLTSNYITTSILDNNNHYLINAATDVSLTYRFVDVQGVYKTEV